MHIYLKNAVPTTGLMVSLKKKKMKVVIFFSLTISIFPE